MSTLFVIPAKAGIQYSTADSIVYWIPACAGMTREEASRRFRLNWIKPYDRATRTQPTAISNVPVIRSGVTVSLSRKTPNAITTMKLTPTNG